MGGKTENPTYEEVCSNTTGHVEVVHITYDTSKVGYDELLNIFFNSHDPTSWDSQNGDIGEQYRSVIFYHNDNQLAIANKHIKELDISTKYAKPIVTVVRKATELYRAEEYHQKYYEKSQKLNKEI